MSDLVETFLNLAFDVRTEPQFRGCKTTCSLLGKPSREEEKAVAALRAALKADQPSKTAPRPK